MSLAGGRWKLIGHIDDHAILKNKYIKCLIEMIKQPAVSCRASDRITAATFILKHLLEDFFLPLLLFFPFSFFLLIVSEVAGLVPANTTLRTAGNSLKLRAQHHTFLYKRGSCVRLESADL